MDVFTCLGCDDNYPTVMGPDHFGHCPDCHENRPEEVKEHIISEFWEIRRRWVDNKTLARKLIEFADIDKAEFLEQDITHDLRPDWFKEGVDYEFHACECWACGRPAPDSIYCGDDDCIHQLHDQPCHKGGE